MNMFGYKKAFNNYSSFIFISPHLDDAILSCGQLVIDLRKLNKDIIIITVFTKASAKTVTPQAKSFLAACGYANPQKLFKDRQKEDSRVAEYLGIKIKHLGFTDAAWRNNGNKKPIYPNEISQFSGNVSRKDRILINKISSRINSLIRKQKGKYLILAPLSVGGHADHVIIQKVVYGLHHSKLFWEDFPYNTNRESLKKFSPQNKAFKRFFKLYHLRFSEKERAIRFYKSQIKSLFPSGKIPHISEGYYLAENSGLF